MIHQRFLSKSFWFFAIVLVVIPYRLADAQLFGSPSIGSPALQQTQQRVPAMAPNPNGMIGGASSAIPSVGSRLQVNSTRFVRGSRSRQDFVGSNRSDQTGVVGVGKRWVLVECNPLLTICGSKPQRPKLINRSRHSPIKECTTLD